MGINFPSSPSVGQKYPASPIVGIPTYTWDGEKWTTIGGAIGSKIPVFTDGSNAMIGQLTVVTPPVALTDAASKAYVDNRVRYDAAQTLTPAQTSQARANINVTKKNYIINGAMLISQENGTNALSGGGSYPTDQFFYNQVNTSGVMFYGQFGPGSAPSGGGKISFTVGTADAAVAAGDYAYISQRIEGLRVSDLRFGTAQAKTVTIQFGVRAPAGTYCVVLGNGNSSGSPRAYVAEYVIAAGEANIDVVKSVTIPGDVTGTWPTDNTIGMSIIWGLMVGTSVQQPAGSWTATTPAGSANSFNVFGTANNVFHLFDVSLTEGTVAPPFVVPDYASELNLCRRYFHIGAGRQIAYTSAAGAATSSTIPWLMRVGPTVTSVWTSVGNVNVAASNVLPVSNLAGMTFMISAAAGTSDGSFTFTANARL